LFAFDDHALPFQQGVHLQLIPFHTSALAKSNQVIQAGPAGAPDSKGSIYYGTVVQVGDELRMWYLGLGDDPGGRRFWRVCYATSRDGTTWEKPDLGLVDFKGSKRNNLVSFGEDILIKGCVVLYDPEDSDASRRFKMVFESTKYMSRFAVAYSPDGLRWTESAHNPKGPWLQFTGGVKWNGIFYLNGQGGRHWRPGGTGALAEMRVMATHASFDFETWTEASAMGFRRDPLPPRPVTRTGSVDGEQVHLGAGLWNRGNVIVGFYGQWHGHPSNDRAWVGMDLGLVVSHDALHFSEPIPDFRIVEAKENVQTHKNPLQGMPALAQGQGFANVGDETLYWYSLWPLPEGGVRMARWKRDRLGFLQPFVSERGKPHVISAPIETGGGPIVLSANVSGLSENAHLVATLLDEKFRPLPGYAAADFAPLTADGFRQRLTWGGNTRVLAPGRIRVRLDFTGLRAEDVKLYAVYAEPAK
jgi:hypothetical protein